MRTLILLALLALIGGCGGCASSGALHEYRAGEASSLFLKFDGPRGAAYCSGTVVAPTVILTAEHCTEGERVLVEVNESPVTGAVVASDGADHVLIRVTEPLDGRVAKLAPMPLVGADIYIWGNPIRIQHLLRRGYVAGTVMQDGRQLLLFDLNAWHGDSGAAIYDQYGRVVAVVYGGYGAMTPLGVSFKMLSAQPIGFTQEQIDALA